MTDAIRKAFTGWNDFLGRDYFRLSDHGTCPIYRDDLDPKIHEWARYRSKDGEAGIKITKNPVTDYVKLTSVVEHELGHSEGMVHIKGPAIMGYGSEHSLDFTDADRIECRRVGLCSP